MTHVFLRDSIQPYYGHALCGSQVRTDTLVEHSPTCEACALLQIPEDPELDILIDSILEAKRKDAA
jgi:hypothetical protein